MNNLERKKWSYCIAALTILGDFEFPSYIDLWSILSFVNYECILCFEIDIWLDHLLAVLRMERNQHCNNIIEIWGIFKMHAYTNLHLIWSKIFMAKHLNMYCCTTDISKYRLCLFGYFCAYSFIESSDTCDSEINFVEFTITCYLNYSSLIDKEMWLVFLIALMFVCFLRQATISTNSDEIMPRSVHYF